MSWFRAHGHDRFITGFSLTAHATNLFSTSPQVTGQLFAADYTSPAPANLTGAVRDMELAFTHAAGRAPGTVELAAGSIGGLTLAEGVYRWGTGVLSSSDLTLDGNATAVWIFQVAQNLSSTNATNLSLTGGALPKNVFWQVSGRVTLGTTSHFEGVILSQTAITPGDGRNSRRAAAGADPRRPRPERRYGTHRVGPRLHRARGASGFLTTPLAWGLARRRR